MGKKSITTCKDCIHYWRRGLLDICIYDGVESACGDMRICSNFEKREVFKVEELPENQELISKADVLRIINAENAVALCCTLLKTVDETLVSICSQINGLPVFRLNSAEPSCDIPECNLDDIESLCTNCANKFCTIGTGGKVRICMMFKDAKGEDMLNKRNCMNFDEEADRCAFGYNCTLNCPDFEPENKSGERKENMEYKKIEITFKSGDTITYNEGEWDDFAYDGNAVIIKKNSAWVGIYNFDSVFCVELK